MKSLFFGLLTVLFFATSCKTYWARQERAWNNIETLKDGVLLVRLQTGNSKVEALKKAGLSEKAEAARNAADARNLRIQKALKEHFDYCPVYFFYSDKSEEILAGNFESVTDIEFKKAQNPKFKEGKWLMGDFGLTQNAVDLSTDRETIPSASKGLYSFVIKNRHFVQLEEPFPYQDRIFEETDLEYNRAAEGMNTALKEYELAGSVKKKKYELKKERKALRKGN